MAQKMDYEIKIDQAFEALDHALEAVDTAENGGVKVHPSVGNRISTAKLILAEVVAELSKSREAQMQPTPEQKQVNTKISYLYRDADNYKVWNDCIIPGVLTKEQQAMILGCLDEGEYFIPSLVGLPEKTFTDLGYSYDEQADHPWFELGEASFERTTAPATVKITPEELVSAFCQRKDHWLASDVSLSLDSPIQGWYLTRYPTDDCGPDINSKVSFGMIFDALQKGEDIYNTLGIGDSVIRERVFEKLAELKGVSYDVLYNMYVYPPVKPSLNEKVAAAEGKTRPKFTSIVPDGRNSGR